MSSIADEGEPWPTTQRARRAILMIDVIESVRLMELDEAGFVHRWLRLVRRVVSEVLPRHEGRFVKSHGDGMLLEFLEARQALAAAFEVNILANDRSEQALRAEPPVPLRMGLHIEEVIINELDIFGTGVNLASRLAGISRVDEVVLSAAARADVVDELDADIEDLGECFLKHVAGSIRAFRAIPVRTGPSLVRPASILAQNGSLPAPALAVLPFTMLLGEVRHAAIGQLVADGLISKLSGSSALRIISRLSTGALAGRSLDVRRVGELLGAQYVVSGSCRVVGTDFSLYAELSSTRTAEVMWCSDSRGTIRELVSERAPLLDSFAEEIARALLREEIRQARTQFLPTLHSSTLLLGSIALMHRQSASDLERARALLDHLSARHPRHATPRAWLGKWYALSAAQGWAHDAADGDRASETIARALDLDPCNSLAWSIKGLLLGYIRRDFHGAEDALREALAQNPNEPLAWLYLATVMGWMQRADDAVQAVEMAQRLSPLDPMRYYFDSLCAAALLGANRYVEAAALAQRSIRRNQAHVPTYKVLAIAQMLAGDGTAARVSVAKVMNREKSFSVARFLQVSPWGKSPLSETFARALREAGTAQD